MENGGEKCGAERCGAQGARRSQVRISSGAKLIAQAPWPRAHLPTWSFIVSREMSLLSAPWMKGLVRERMSLGNRKQEPRTSTERRVVLIYPKSPLQVIWPYFSTLIQGLAMTALRTVSFPLC